MECKGKLSRQRHRILIQAVKIQPENLIQIRLLFTFLSECVWNYSVKVAKNYIDSYVQFGDVEVLHRYRTQTVVNLQIIGFIRHLFGSLQTPSSEDKMVRYLSTGNKLTQ